MRPRGSLLSSSSDLFHLMLLVLFLIPSVIADPRVDALMIEEELIYTPKAKSKSPVPPELLDIEPLTTSEPLTPKSRTFARPPSPVKEKGVRSEREEKSDPNLKKTMETHTPAPQSTPPPSGEQPQIRKKRQTEITVLGAESGEGQVLQKAVWDLTDLHLRYVRSSEEKLPEIEEAVVAEDDGKDYSGDVNQGDDEGSGFGENVKDDSNSPQNDLHVELPNAPTPPPPPPPFVHQMREEERPYAGSQMIPMKGERGEQGPPGVCTQQCRDGAPGMSGPAGPEGRQGIQGQQGPPGPPGSAGPSGGIGPFDESGTRSVPGPQGPSGPPGSQGPQGVQGPRGETGMPGRDGRSYEGLTQNDIDRILRDPRVKGEKGECVSSSDSSDFSSNSLTSSDGELPPYDPHKHRNTIKGQKGERGDSGPMGPPGQPGQPGQTSQGAGGPAHMPVYQTTVELFAAGRNLREGSLVFVTSSQQLFIRVTNGWKEILLGAFHPIIEPRASVEPPTPHAPHHHFPLPPRPVVPEYSRDQAPQTSLYQPQHKDRVLHMIALNAPFSGNMRGLRGADLQCYRQARQAGFVTTFRAMLSSKVQDLKRIVHSIDHETPIVNLNGDVLFASWNDILQDKPLPNKPLYAFNRQDVIRSAQWSDKRMWHGSTEGGLREDGAFCDGWRTTNNFENGLAGELYPGKALIGSGQKVGCETKLVVLCVENMSKFNVDRILAKKNVHSRD